ncbi:MAG: putative 2OG-Fe(II) oxygenase [Hyphomonadaceae bacterium]|nr:putative 2OG-Fe(II) oxygenase [Hyphomonadaceae bacterium]
MTSKEAMARAQALREAGDWAGSARVLAPVVKGEPGNLAAAYYYGMALLEAGDPASARVQFDRLIRAGKHLAEAHYMMGRTQGELGETETARRHFESAHQLKPTPATLRSVANLAWMSSDFDRFHHVLSHAPAPLAVSAYGLLVEAEELDAASSAWTRLGAMQRTGVEAQFHRSQHMQKAGDGPASLAAAKIAFAGAPGVPTIVDALAVAELMCGNGQGALAAIAGIRQAQPDNQHWIAHEATALRILGDPRYAHLVDMDAHVRAHALPVPEGYDTIEAFNRDFVAALDAERSFSHHPIDQSLRIGVQTSQSLLQMNHPAVRAYIKALDGPIREYMREIGSAPDHPLTRRNTGNYRITGCWSVRLKPGGYHVSHVHPQGWISSAYYAEVPQETLSGKGRGGWIKFGEPPFVTQPKLEPEKWVQPRAGLLVLFPSYLWHGTQPIGEGAERVTAPFDAVPA